MSNPYLIEQPFVVSFSGGRTSGYMLRQILDAHGGRMPEHGKVIFCNTGKERVETLDFVERCSIEWNVEIVWLEYRHEPGKHTFAVVNYATASRDSEPFNAIIESRKMLPNVMMRFCTVELKVLTSHRYIKSLGWSDYFNAVGIRYDEPRRHANLEQANAHRHAGEEVLHPLFDARATLTDVMEFWSKQPFDLQLAPYEGNCDLCFLKGQGKLLRIMQDHPELAEWWIEQEQRFAGKTRLEEAGRFRKNAPSYRATLELAQQPGLFDVCDTDSVDCRCTD